jgi:holo-[acyl-carrier protein] synthase
MIFGIGTDIVEVKRIKDAIELYGKRFLDRIFTKIEQEYCDSFNEKKYVHYAARFAVKESFSKAIGTGITKGFKFQELWIENLESGEPILKLAGYLAENYGKYTVKVSLSHTDNNAISYLIMEDNN